MADVGDFIRQRWPIAKQKVMRLDDRKQALLAQLDEVNSELEEANQEIAALTSAAKTLNLNLDLFLSLDGTNNQKFDRHYKFGDVPIKQAIRLTLEEFADGLSSHDLLAAISRRYFENRLPRTSFSPQLSRLKQDGEVELAEAKWRMTSKGREVMFTGTILPYGNSIFD